MLVELVNNYRILAPDKMEERIGKLLNNYTAKTYIGETLSINDLRDKQRSGDPLTQREKQALENFENYRLAELNKTDDDMLFHRRYRELQVMANLGDYEEFLKDQYFL